MSDRKPKSTLEAYIRHCSTIGEQLYGVVDAARDHDLVVAARDQFDMQVLSLFEEPLASDLADVAPYVVAIGSDPMFLHIWCRRIGNNSGILLLADTNLATIRQHLARLFVVTDEQGEQYYFRFYDSRVLRAFMRTCTGPEGNELFGPVRSLLVESETSGNMFAYQCDRTGIRMSERSLSEFAAAVRTGTTT